jgi:glycosyltransferase involved in cell wall biosynthesis
VDHFIANSNFVKRRIDKYYHRDSAVINPPVETDKFSIKTKSEIENYYLLVGRMMRYKKMDLVIEAFNKNGLPLKVVGRGMEYKRLKKMAGDNIEFLGRVPDEDLAQLYSAAQAFIFPQEEDFGIVAIEALASGRPVIAYQAGDIQENIIDGRTGIFFKEQTAASLNEAIKKFQKMSFDSEFIRNQALKFDRRIFEDKIRRFVEEKWREKQNQEIENMS